VQAGEAPLVLLPPPKSIGWNRPGAGARRVWDGTDRSGGRTDGLDYPRVVPAVRPVEPAPATITTSTSDERSLVARAQPGPQRPADGERDQKRDDHRDGDGEGEGRRRRRRRGRRRRGRDRFDGDGGPNDGRFDGGDQSGVGGDSGGGSAGGDDDRDGPDEAGSFEGDVDGNVREERQQTGDDRQDAEGRGGRRRKRRRRRGGFRDDAEQSGQQQRFGANGQGGSPAGGQTGSHKGDTDDDGDEIDASVPATIVRGIVDIPAPGARGFGATFEVRLRQMGDGLVEGANDPYVPAELIQKHQLRPCQQIEAEVVMRSPRRRRSNHRGPRPTVQRVIAIEGLPPEVYAARKAFADLTPLDPAPRMSLEYRGCPPSCRLIDLFCPIGFGTRGLIVAPPKAGKTILLQNIAFGIKQNHPQVELIALLIDERPEEVTDFKRNVPAQVLASSNDQDLDRHLMLGILAIERAKRMVEAGRDVVVLLDSLTRLGRAFNNSRRYGSSGRTMSGGLDSRALEVPKQLFGAARRAEEGGSLTIIATCLVDTGSRADQVIFEEFKGTGNMELILDREIADKRTFPAINLAASGTRKEHLLLTEPAMKTITALRRRLLAVPPHVQIEQLLAALQRFDTNERLIAG
jgi:transcription termination factor Rho